MTVVRTRNAIFMSAGILVLTSIGLSRINRRWLILGGLVGAALIHAGTSGFCRIAYLLEKSGITKPDHGLYEEEKLRNIHKLRLIKKIRRVRREISNHIKEVEDKGVFPTT